MIYSACEEKCWDRLSIPSRRWKTNAYTAWCPIKKRNRMVVDQRNVYFCQKIWMRLHEEAFVWNMARISKYAWNWEIEILHEGWIILFLFVIVCAWKFPSNPSQSRHPKQLTPQDLLAPRLRPCQGVQSSCSDVAHDLKLMARNAGTDFLYPGDEN